MSGIWPPPNCTRYSQKTRRHVLLYARSENSWEVREFSNLAKTKTRVRMLSFRVFHFSMLFTSGPMFGHNILGPIRNCADILDFDKNRFLT